jgi:hypothetical protein
MNCCLVLIYLLLFLFQLCMALIFGLIKHNVHLLCCAEEQSLCNAIKESVKNDLDLDLSYSVMVVSFFASLILRCIVMPQALLFLQHTYITFLLAILTFISSLYFCNSTESVVDLILLQTTVCQNVFNLQHYFTFFFWTARVMITILFYMFAITEVNVSSYSVPVELPHNLKSEI